MTKYTRSKKTTIQVETLEPRKLFAGVDMAFAQVLQGDPYFAPVAYVAKPQAMTQSHVHPAIPNAVSNYIAVPATQMPTVSPNAFVSPQSTNPVPVPSPSIVVQPSATNSPSMPKVELSTALEKRNDVAASSTNNGVTDLKPILGKQIEDLLRRITPSWGRTNVVCTEFTLKANGDLTIKAKETYFDVNVKLEIKTNLFDDSKFKLKVTVGFLPISFGINASIIKPGLAAWIAANRIQLRP